MGAAAPTQLVRMRLLLDRDGSIGLVVDAVGTRLRRGDGGEKEERESGHGVFPGKKRPCT